MNRISPQAKIGKGTKVHADACTICPGAVIGKNCNIGNGAFIPPGTVIKDGVFLGQNATIINDNLPRAINPDGTVKDAGDWEPKNVLVKRGATIGANSTILGGVTIGKFAMVGAGSVVTADVMDYWVVRGNPARHIHIAADAEKYGYRRKAQ
jgi:acetyltransferase-like isoleucine patch superfamily enzyme